VSVIRIAPVTLADLAGSIQRELGDTIEGRFTLTGDVYPAINGMLVQMGRYLRVRNSGESALITTMTYTGPGPADLPAAVGNDHVYRVQEYSNSNFPFEIPFSPLQEFIDHDTSQMFTDINGRTLGAYKYTLLGPTTDQNTHRIQLSPRPTGSITLRIMHGASPFIFSDSPSFTTSDTAPLDGEWRELIELGAIRKLARRDDELTLGQEQQYQELWREFLLYSSRQRGTQMVRRRRKGIS